MKCCKFSRSTQTDLNSKVGQTNMSPTKSSSIIFSLFGLFAMKNCTRLLQQQQNADISIIYRHITIISILNYLLFVVRNRCYVVTFFLLCIIPEHCHKQNFHWWSFCIMSLIASKLRDKVSSRRL